ncbi:hypothetical protein MP228_009407 [Amoeboaphelidium protococcarum]|nr:hypothetical protein MP228_009407 [Amoeboaphelidium protococcarum]
MADNLLQQYVVQTLESFVLGFAAEMSYITDRNSSLKGSWYLSPAQHAIEFVVTNMFTITTFLYYINKVFNHHAGLEKFISDLGDKAAGTKRSWLERVVHVSLVVTFIMTLKFTYVKGFMLFVLQPCHITNLMYIYLLTLDTRRKLPHIMFNILLHLSWGILLAVVQPDLRDSHQFMEKHFFWYEHIILLALPIWCMWKKRFYVMPLQMNLALASFLGLAVYHSLILATVSLLSGVNVNYMLKPPIGLLEMFGAFYRPVMYLFCFALTFLMRFVIWEVVIRAVDKLRGHQLVDGGDKDQNLIQKSNRVKKEE